MMENVVSEEVVPEQVLTLREQISNGFLENWLQKMLPGFISFFWSVVLALVAFFIGVRIIRLVRRVIQRIMHRRKVEEGVCQFADQVIKILLYLFLGVIILNLFGIGTSSIAAAIASLGLTVGLAMQGALSNFAGGVLILILKPFVLGDYIREDTFQNEGTVTQISIFYTKLTTIDQKVVVIPNGTLANNSMTNYTMEDRRILDLTFSISYEDDIRLAKETLYKVAKQESDLPEEEPLIFIDELADSSVEVGVRFYVSTENYWNIRWSTLENGKLALDAAGIRIPYPQMDVHMEKTQVD